MGRLFVVSNLDELESDLCYRGLFLVEEVRSGLQEVLNLVFVVCGKCPPSNLITQSGTGAMRTSLSICDYNIVPGFGEFLTAAARKEPGYFPKGAELGQVRLDNVIETLADGCSSGGADTLEKTSNGNWVLNRDGLD